MKTRWAVALDEMGNTPAGRYVFPTPEGAAKFLTTEQTAHPDRRTAGPYEVQED